MSLNFTVTCNYCGKVIKASICENKFCETKLSIAEDYHLDGRGYLWCLDCWEVTSEYEKLLRWRELDKLIVSDKATIDFKEWKKKMKIRRRKK